VAKVHSLVLVLVLRVAVFIALVNVLALLEPKIVPTAVSL
jgi:hypothetical protein